MNVRHAGIFVDDILDAVPIDKWFEMFKPMAAGEGGFIRVHMSYSEENASVVRDPSPIKPVATPGNVLAHKQLAFKSQAVLPVPASRLHVLVMVGCWNPSGSLATHCCM